MTVSQEPKEEIEILLENENETVYAVEKNFFPILHVKKEGYAVLLGRKRISEFFEKMEEAIQDSKRNDVDRIITIIQIINEINK